MKFFANKNIIVVFHASRDFNKSSLYILANSYKITVFTGNKRGAGTDANVYITLFGKQGDSAERKLDNSENNFEKGK